MFNRFLEGLCAALIIYLAIFVMTFLGLIVAELWRGGKKPKP